MINIEALFNISYGLYIVCSGDNKKGNGYISNTVFQVTAEPAKFAASCNKNNYTADIIKKAGAFSVSVLHIDASSDIIGNFGYKSGKDIDKMKGMDLRYGETGVPIVTNDSIAYFECKVVQTIDVGTHILFIGELVGADVLDNSKEPMTYLYYRNVKKGFSPKNAPTYIDKSKLDASKPKDLNYKRFKCEVCGYIYDESEQDVKFEDLPEDWVCPICFTDKADFIEI